MSMPTVTRLHPRLVSYCVVLLAVIWFSSFSNAKGIPLADYHRNLQRAITAIDTLAQSDEEEAPAEYEKRFAETIAAIRALLPKNQMVESDQDIFSVDNTWLHSDLNEFQEASQVQRPTLLAHLIERLKALEERVDELQNPVATSRDKTGAKEKLAGILARPEYAPKGKTGSAFMRLLRDFVRWVQSFFPQRSELAPSQANSLVRFAQILVIAIAVIVLVYVLVTFLPHLARATKRREKKKQQARIVLGEQLATDESAHDLLAEADALARNGNIRAAIRKAYIALLVELGDRQLISLAQHKTNRDYLRSVRAVPSLYTGLNNLTDIFERHWYGLAQATANDWHEFRSGYEATLQARS